MAVKRKIDFTDVGDGFKMLPEGDYLCHIFDVVDKPSKKGDPGVNIILKVAEEGVYKGQQIFYYLSEVPAALWKVRDFLQACGAAIPKKAVTVDYDKCLGKKVVVTIVHGIYNSKPSMNVDNVAAPGSNEENGLGNGEEDDDIPF